MQRRRPQLRTAEQLTFKLILVYSLFYSYDAKQRLLRNLCLCKPVVLDYGILAEFEYTGAGHFLSRLNMP